MLAARAAEDLAVGTTLRVEGHHHEIAGVAPVMIDPADAVAPYYLLDGARLARPVAAGSLIGLADVEGVDEPALAAYLAGTAATTTTNGDDR